MTHTQTTTANFHVTARDWDVTLFKNLAVTTFLLGFVFHVTGLVIGLDRFVRVFTPPFDVAFGVLILAAAIPGVRLWRRYDGGRRGRWGYAFALALLVVSVPIHLATLWTWSTDYLLIAPRWYSMVEVPMFLALAYMVTRLKFASA